MACSTISTFPAPWPNCTPSPARPSRPETQTGRAEAEKLARAAGLLGLLQDDPADWELKGGAEVEVDEEAVEKLVAERLEARKSRNFAESDRLRDALTEMGVKLKDGKDPATGEPITDWEVA